MPDEKKPSNYRTLYQALLAGGVLAAIGIVLFLVIYAVLNEVDPATRLFTALCAPPVAIAILTGLFVLMINRSRSE
ncbi:hypothetical protein G4Y79_18330 [Phototrophicus methaneseepsis]|uniref:Uncharacterized protein n=1 Tax=Phototrophicus methaneseepsis TaxID=2710758 RepID=A0A7S8IDK5_9CHLR|nr:hypothetical protein [Phototrophicus methaneseepsis]QPC81631.1 hypothetical protein G4Y79_18330 [Phototrophicus methaneseepsis]